jgi:trans-2,3-dihydro-3-hydroxyanthranilate isomerase
MKGQEAMNMLEYELHDVFTNRPFSGNGLAVARNGDALSSEQMQAIAREFNLSETVFLLSPSNPAHSARIRIFTPFAELPFAGHPTVGTAVMLATDRLGENVSEEKEAIIVLEEEVGPIRIGVRMQPGGAPFAEFDLPQMPKERNLTSDAEDLSIILGLTRREIGFENHEPSCFDAGLPFIFAPVANLEAMAKIEIDAGAMKKLLPAKGPRMIYAYCRESVMADSSFHARMFAPLHGISEDPATGSAAAAFAGVVMKFDQPPGGRRNCILEQGLEMKRPSRIYLELVVDGDLRNVRIGGHVTRVARGNLDISGLKA